jgi:hypothetical protein
MQNAVKVLVSDALGLAEIRASLRPLEEKPE